MFVQAVLSLVPIALLVSSTPLSKKEFSLFEEITSPKGWTRLGDAPSERVLDLRIALAQGNFAELERHLYEVSDPAHLRYGKHLSDEDVHGLVAPHDHTLDAVKEWLTSHGILESASYSPAKDWISVAVPVSKAEQMLATKYGVYQHDDGDYVIRTEAYSLPKYLHGHIDLVQPTTMFGRVNRMRSAIVSPKTSQAISAQQLQSSAASDPLCQQGILVLNSCLRKLYNTFGYTPASGGKSQIGVTGYLGEIPLQSDLQEFLLVERIDALGYKFGVQSINGGITSQIRTPQQLLNMSGTEANLDAQTVAGFVAPLPSTFYSTGGQPPFTPDVHEPTNDNEPYLEFLNYVLAQPSIPQVFSTSYGDDEQTVPISYAQRVCQGFAQLGAKGVSVIFASGDSGVGVSGTCTTNDGQNKTQFIPSFPASCPYVTTVGATEGISPEVAVTSFGSGAGFSNYFAQPSYQSAVVNAYVASLGDQYAGLYNKSGRAYPDVAAQGSNYAIAYAGLFLPVSGTSASTPTFSSVIALLNDYLISKGKPVLGFLNPFLYQTGYKGLNDITTGSSFGCDTNGFPSATGWDAVTGLGTPDFIKLQQLVG